MENNEEVTYNNSVNYPSDLDRGAERVSCNECRGYTTHYKFCGQLINWLYGRPIEYQSSTIHRCPELVGKRRYYR